MDLESILGAMKRALGLQVIPYQFSFILLSPLRRLILSPKELAGRLELKEDSAVLEVGPGPGFYSLEVARSIPQGLLVLVDIQPQMLEAARKRLEGRGISNVEYKQGDGKKLPFSEATFDVAYMVAVICEEAEPCKCFREFYRVLRPDGLVSISELTGDPDYVSFARINAIAGKVGFVLDKVYSRGKSYTANFRKPASQGV